LQRANIRANGVQSALQYFLFGSLCSTVRESLYCAFCATVNLFRKSSARDKLISEVSQFATASFFRYPALN